MDHIGPFTFQTIRCALAVIFLLLTATLFDLKKYGFSGSLARWKNPALWKAGLICGAALFVAASLQQVGLVYTRCRESGLYYRHVYRAGSGDRAVPSP